MSISDEALEKLVLLLQEACALLEEACTRHVQSPEPQVEEKLRGIRITPEELGLSVRAQNAIFCRDLSGRIHHATIGQIKTVADLVDCYERGALHRIRNFGEKSYQEVERKLLDLGATWAPHMWSIYRSVHDVPERNRPSKDQT